jgi:hypothetical protein
MSVLARAAVAVGLGAAVLALAAGSSAAPKLTTYGLVGYEYGFTSTVGHFAGTASGSGVDVGGWNARVEHDRLGSKPTYVNGATFELATHESGWSVDTVTGTFVRHGGTIATLDSGANCTNQRYLVTGRLRDVSTGASSGGTGTFAVVLTHYRYSILGHCVIYKARATGNVSFSSP